MAKTGSTPRRHRSASESRPVELTFESPRVGLVLGGGAVRGAAHIGVLDALDTIGFHADVVCGTSIGALIGAAYAAGVPTRELSDTFSDLHWKDLTRLSLHRNLGLLDTTPLRRLLEGLVGDVNFDELPIAFAAVACDVTTGRRVVMTAGSVVDAAMASSAIPGLFVPVKTDHAILVDGGLVDNLPVDVARSLGADYVVAVDVVPACQESRRPEDVREMLLTSFEIIQRSTEREGRLADCYIAPDVGGFSIAELAVIEDLRCRGYDAAIRAAPQLCHDLGLTMPTQPVTCGGENANALDA